MAAQFDATKATKAMDQYSRQIGTIGVETMQRLASLDVLVVGVRGVGIEVAKNIALLGAHSVTLADDEPVRVADLGVNYWLTENDIGRPRAEVCVSELAKLNPFTEVHVHKGAVNESHLVRFGAVIVTVELPRATLERWGDVCHNHTQLQRDADGNVFERSTPILFIVALNLGAAAFYFSDMGNGDLANESFRQHTITDDNGEPPVVNVVESIMYGEDERGPRVVVRVPASRSHNLQDGDSVYFSEVKIADLCRDSDDDAATTGGSSSDTAARLAFPVERIYADDKLVPDHFVVRPTKCAEFATYTAGGFATQVKQAKHLTFRPFSRSVVSPATESCQFGSMLAHLNSEAVFASRGEHLHMALLGVWRFVERNGHLPRLHNTADADETVRYAEELLAEHKALSEALTVDSIDKELVSKLALYAAAELPSYAAILGGVAAQEIVKRSGKYTPMHQWLYLDTFEMLADQVPADATPIGSRYDHQVSVFGRAFQERIGTQRWFMVGCGALGCEYLKAFALMGLGANGGEIHVTDMDRIEVSNLNRQFLFRAENVGHPKSKCAAEAARRMNPAMNVKHYEVRVGPDTENIFNTQFWNSLDGVCNALDNVHARRYTDSRCVLFKRPLLESGTLGTKANSEIIIPNKTQSYNDVKEVEDDTSIPMCTLRLFPHLIDHCIEWARAEFHDTFEGLPKDANKLLSDSRGFFTALYKGGNSGTRLEKLRHVKRLLDVVAANRAVNYADCVQLAVDLYLNRFRDRINDLTFSCPENFTQKNKLTGADEPFWTGTRRFPQSAAFPFAAEPAAAATDDSDPRVAFLHAATNLYAFAYGVPPVRTVPDFRQTVVDLVASSAVTVPEWAPPKKPVKVDDDASNNNNDDDADADEQLAQLKALEDQLRTIDASTFRALEPADFEKDDDTNFHIDFITACSNMRAWNYHIKQATRFKCKMIAGRITPALATTTAMITGVVLNELYKYLVGVPVDKQLQTNINLATGTFNSFSVDPPKKAVGGFDPDEGDDVIPVPEGWDTWSTVVLPVAGLTVRQAAASLSTVHHGVEASKLSVFGVGRFFYKRTVLPTDDAEWLKAALDRPFIDVINEMYGNQTGEYVRLDGSFETADGDLAIIPPLYAKLVA